MLVDLTEFLIKSIAKEPDMVSVKMFDVDDENSIIEVLVSDNDMGCVIGKNGSMANAIRTIVQATSYNNGLKKIKINFDSL